MSPLNSRLVREVSTLLALWLFSHRGRPFLGTLEREAAGSRFALLDLLDGRLVRLVDSDDTSVRAADARVLGSRLAVVMELNRGAALGTTTVDLAAALDPTRPALTFEDQRTLGLPATLADAVQIAPAASWNVAGPLPPDRWLFSPRLVRGAQDRWLVVANTADGQAVLLDGLAPGGSGTMLAPHAALPQAIGAPGPHTLAFLRNDTGVAGYSPFWQLPRYHRSARESAQALWVKALDSGQENNLSTSLGLGPVQAFALAAGPAGGTWIWAMQVQAAGPRLLALAQREGRWSIATSLRPDHPGEQLAAEYVDQQWHLSWAHRAGDRWALRHAAWRP